MYLDDGISRDSAPGHGYYVPETFAGPGYGIVSTTRDVTDGLVDPKAQSRFCHVQISQVSFLLSPTFFLFLGGIYVVIYLTRSQDIMTSSLENHTRRGRGREYKIESHSPANDSFSVERIPRLPGGHHRTELHCRLLARA